MKELKVILNNVVALKTIGDTAMSVSKIEFDSRKVTKNDLFVALKGTLVDGHAYIDKAISLGASVIVCQELPKEVNSEITYIQVSDANAALAQLAANYYDSPSKKLKLVGVTGTNGKTTIATLLYQQYKNAGYKVGLLSTVKIMVNDAEYPTMHTTPDSVLINKYLSMMVNDGVDFCFMEVSSHGIDQKRTEGLQFAGGIFTNLTHDHLDYHNTFSDYRDVKKQFFDALPKTAFALTNIDDKNGEIMLQNTKAKKVSYALKTYANYTAQILENQFSGLVLKINNNDIWTKLIGKFNAYNLLAIYAVSDLLGMENTENLRLISLLENVSGRFEYIVSEEQKVTAIVDYAHTPDALKNVLETINAIRTGNEQLITVVGCGGDRDKTKRPKMAHIATQMSTTAIFTSDNPRSENPETIIEEMEAGVLPENFSKSLSVSNRLQAIKTACQMANKNDIILIAGKGHEAYQEVNGVRTDFDDLQNVKDLFIKLKK